MVGAATIPIWIYGSTNLTLLPPTFLVSIFIGVNTSNPFRLSI